MRGKTWGLIFLWLIIIVGAILFSVVRVWPNVHDLIARSSVKTALEQSPVTKELNQLIENRSEKIKVKLYFSTVNNDACEADVFKQIEIKNPSEDLALIPQVIDLLLTAKTDGNLDDGWFSGLPVPAKLLSFGYEDGKVTLNFNTEMNVGGGSCMMGLRRQQLEKTTFSLNEISELKIKTVEIQVDGETETALQP